MDRIWSEQQNAIFRFFVDAIGHLIVRARAGTGKTTTIEEAVKRFAQRFPGLRIVICAFNKKIAQELKARFIGLAGIEVKTLHAIGFSIVLKFWERIPVEDPKTQKGLRAKGLTERACGPAVPDAIKKLVNRLHTLGRETTPHATVAADLLDLAVEHSLVPDEEWQAHGYDANAVCGYAVQAMKLAEARPAYIDYADMIFLPVRHHWLAKWVDLVVVDEAQDMTLSQLEIAEGICKGRMVLVGDDRQAIYGFRGADSGSLDRLKDKMGADELGLTATRRCCRAVVAEAAKIVPDFEADASNPEGEILTIPEGKLAAEAQLGDFVLSRTTAPLVSTAMAFLRAGKRALVAGKNIGGGLLDVMTRLSSKSRSVPEFLERLAGWEEREIARARKAAKSEEAAEHRATEIHDQADMLRNLADGARNLKEISDRIEALFTDDGLGQAGVITCSSIHRSKGLEANRVFILADTLKSGTIEEDNLRYVAITRAKQTLVWVA